MATPPLSGIGNVQVILQGVTSGSAPGGATNVPPGILALPNGTLLRGQIVQFESGGFAVLRTPKGDLTLKTELSLRRGLEVVIRLDTALSDIKAKIISIDGLTPREYQQAASKAPLQPTALNVEDVLDLPDTLRPLTEPATQPGKSNPLPPTTNTATAITDSVDITTTHQPMVLRAVLLSRAAGLPQLLPQLPASVPVPPQRLDAGATVTVTIIPGSIQPPGTPAALATSTLTTAPFLTPTPAAASATTGTTAATLPAGTVPSAQPAASQPVATLPSTPSSQPAAPIPAPPATLAASATAPTTTVSTITTPATSHPVPPTARQPQPAAPTTPLTVQKATPAAPGSAAAPTTPTTPVSASVTPAATPALMPAVAAAPPLTAPTPPSTTVAVATTQTGTAPPANPQIPATGVAPAEPASASLLRQGILPAQVLGTEQSGETVLKTPLGVLKLDLVSHTGQRISLPHHATLQLQLQSLEAAEAPPPLPLEPAAGAARPLPSTSPAGLTELTRHWQSLQDMLSVLQQQHSLIAQEFLQNIMPKPNAAMGRDVLFFLSALKLGNLDHWTGKKPLEALEQSLRGDLIRKLGAEMGTLRQLFVDAPNPNWQSAFIPVCHEGEWQQMRLFIKRDKPQSSSNDPNEATGTRFIVEVDFSRLGPMQFDGFVKKSPTATQNTHFDLVIRSTRKLPDTDQQAIRAIFAEASELTGFTGGLNFQVGQPFPVQPLEEVLKSDRNVIA